MDYMTTTENTPMNNVETIITNAAALIREYNPALATKFITEPFQRVNLAFAFAAGFDDVHPVAALVIRAAIADRDARLG
jgi:high-affinity nickel permease